MIDLSFFGLSAGCKFDCHFLRELVKDYFLLVTHTA